VGTLAAGVAHEINNPLAYVLGNVQSSLRDLPEILAALRSKKPDNVEEVERIMEDMKEALKEAEQGAHRVRDIVRDLKTFSRNDGDERVAVDLSKVMELVCHMSWNEVRHRAKLVKDYAELPWVLGSESQLSQVFLNLLINAAQAIPEGHAEENEIRLGARVEGGRVTIDVKDTGQGIPPELRDRIFDPFFTTKPVGEGTGLGLSIVHNIVTAAGGTIEVDSKVGQGTSFRVTLPITEPPASAARVTSPARAKGAKVLVVDDEVPVASAIRRALRGHLVTTAATGEEALKGLRGGERYDVIFCDLMMPEMTGMELYEEITRAFPEQAERMVFLTGGAFTPAAREFLETVKNARLEKPFETEQLLAQIRRLTEGRALRLVAS
jgi:CheY-like chemotaxis protein/two-component sensor histidine kinase